MQLVPRFRDRLSLSRAIALTAVFTTAGCYDGLGDAEGNPWVPGDSGIGTASETDGGDTDGESSVGDSGASGSGGSDSSDPSTGGSSASGGDDGGTSGDSAGDDGWGSTGGADDSGGDGSTGGLTGADSGDDSGGDDGGGADDVPDNAYCSEVADWDPQWAQLEEQILELTNQERAAGADCGQYGYFGPAPALTMDPALRCSSRVHSKDMADQNFFDHVNPQGEDPFDRMQMAGYNYFTAGENIAGGSSTAQGSMDQWMNSDGHCKNIMNPDYEHLGVGYYPGGPYSTGWTQNFGAN